MSWIFSKKSIYFKLADSPIEANYRLKRGDGKEIDVRRFKQLIGKLIYHSHTPYDIDYAVGIVNSCKILTPFKRRISNIKILEIYTWKGITFIK